MSFPGQRATPPPAAGLHWYAARRARHEPRAAGYALQATRSAPRAPRATRRRLCAAGYTQRVVRHRPRATRHAPRATRHATGCGNGHVARAKRKRATLRGQRAAAEQGARLAFMRGALLAEHSS